MGDWDMKPHDLPTADRLACATRAKYMAGCRCLPCRAANSRYECERAVARKAGDWNGLVPAVVARAHLVKLSRRGVGRRAVAAASDVSHTILQDIRSGKKTQIRQRTERRILAVTADALSDRALVPAGRTHALIANLLDEGFTKKEIARRLGYLSPALQLNRTTITAKNAARVERFYRLLMAEASA
jgi:hypothetical protein